MSPLQHRIRTYGGIIMLYKIKPFVNARLGTKVLICQLITAAFLTAAVILGLLVLLNLAAKTLVTLIIIGVLTAFGIFLSFYLSRFLGGYLKYPLEGMTLGLQKMTEGDLSYFDNDMIIGKDTKDELILHSAYFLDLLFATREKVSDTNQIASGDLTTQIHVRCPNDQLGNALNELVHNTHQIVSAISVTADQVASGANMVSDSSYALSQGAAAQASSVQQLTASLTEVSAKTNESAQNAFKANELAQNAKNNADLGNEQMKEMLGAMDEINVSSNNIGRIIKVIDDIAFQTNILALNAAVEAARAGQHGKGFAVVAEEVRNLAAKSANAAKETTDMIEGSMKKVEAGTKIANNTADALNQIVEQIEKAASLVNAITISSNEQAMAIEQINQSISLVSEVVQTNAATAEESAAASEELSAQAAQLKEAVNAFTIETENIPVTKRPAERPRGEIDPQPAAAVKSKISLEDDFGKY